MTTLSVGRESKSNQRAGLPGWSYLLHGYQKLEVYRNPEEAIVQADLENVRLNGEYQVYVEKVWTNRAGVHNQYAKGARVIYIARLPEERYRECNCSRYEGHDELCSNRGER